MTYEVVFRFARVGDQGPVCTTHCEINTRWVDLSSKMVQNIVPLVFVVAVSFGGFTPTEGDRQRMIYPTWCMPCGTVFGSTPGLKPRILVYAPAKKMSATSAGVGNVASSLSEPQIRSVSCLYFSALWSGWVVS